MADKAYLDKDGLAEVWSAVEDQVAEASEEIIKVKTVSGDIVSIDDANAYPALDVKVDIEPVQDGTPWMAPTVDTAPYLLRPSPDLDHDYNSEIDTLVGGTVAWNQLVTNGNFADTSEWSAKSGTFSVSGNVGTYTITSIASESYGNRLQQSRQLISGHKYLYSVTHKESKSGLKFAFGGWASTTNIYVDSSTTWATSSCVSIPVYAPDWFSLRLDDGASNRAVGDSFDVKNCILTDLTAFNSEIADYVYSLEQATSGTGIAWLKEHFPKLFDEYHAYEPGSLVSVKTSEHKTVGFNQWDEEWELGIINSTTGQNVASSGQIRTKNYMPVMYADYYLTVTSEQGSNTNISARFYDADKNYIGYRNAAGDVTFYNSVFRPPVNARYMRWNMQVSYGTTYNHDICINISKATGTPKNGDYVAYESHSYPLDSDLELRGIPKLSNGNLYYDGDEYTADGTVTRKYKRLLFDGTEEWGQESASWNSHGTPVFYYTLTENGKRIAPIASTIPNIIGTNIKTVSYNDLKATEDYLEATLTGSSGGYISISANFSTASDWKAWLSNNPIKLVYELATPTTETADSFASPQIVSPNGTEEYVDERSVPVPVGHRTTYMMPYPISGWDEVKTYLSPTEEEEDATIYTINLNGTKYGGTVDVTSGVMMVDRVEADLGGLDWTHAGTNESGRYRFETNGLSSLLKGADTDSTANLLCSLYLAKSARETYRRSVGVSATANGRVQIYDAVYETSTAADFKQMLTDTNAQLVYELAEPIEIDLTPHQIELLESTNHIWADAGDTTLKYAVMGDDMYDFAAANKLYIDQLVEEKDSKFSPVGFSGELVSFEANQEYPLLDLNVDINPVQDLHGYSKPWAPGNGKNKLGIVGESINMSGVIEPSPTAARTAIFKVSTGDVIYGKKNATFSSGKNMMLRMYDSSMTFLNSTTLLANSATSGSYTIPSGVSYIGCVQFFDSTFSEQDLKTYEVSVTVNENISFEPYSNICPISGRTECDVNRTGKNLLFKKLSGVNVISTGDITQSGSSYGLVCAKVIEGETYSMAWMAGYNFVYAFFDSEPFEGSVSYNRSRNVEVAQSPTFTFTAPITGYVTIRVDGPDATMPYYQLEFGSSATAYHAYNGNTYIIDLGETRYGCKLNVPSGKLRVTHEVADIGDLTWEYQSANTRFVANISGIKNPAGVRRTTLLCSCYECVDDGRPIADVPNGSIYGGDGSGTAPYAVFIKDLGYTDANTFKTARTGEKIVYPLATPVEIQLDPTEITTLLGTNHIWADTGDIEGQYAQLTDDFKDLSMADRRAMSILIEQKLREHGLIS